ASNSFICCSFNGFDVPKTEQPWCHGTSVAPDGESDHFSDSSKSAKTSSKNGFGPGLSSIEQVCTRYCGVVTLIPQRAHESSDQLSLAFSVNTSGRKIKRNRALIGCGKQQELGSVPAVLLIRLLRGSAFW